MNKNIIKLVLCTALVISSITHSEGMLSLPGVIAARPQKLSPEDHIRQTINTSFARTFNEVVKRDATQYETTQRRAIQEKVLIQLLFNGIKRADD